MDDILLSHADNEALLAEPCSLIEEAASQCFLTLSDEKKQGPATKITAFNIEIEHDCLAVGSDRLDRFAHRILQLGWSPPTHGILGYVRQVNLAQADQLMDLLPA